MGLHIGDTAPDFTTDTSTGRITFHDWIGSAWVFFFSHPGDFTPVCTTEIGRTAQLADEFAKRNVKPLGLSTDGVEDHLKWIEDVDDTQHTTLTYPMNVGRNFNEILRVIDAVQLADVKKIATPADWEKGGEVIIPTSIDTAAAKVQFPQGWTEIRPYLRTTRV
ncbi:redoxin domain-containing protein [Fodinicurvata sp. EGI_FJ10296]|uniref:redoxin domain-containing protein n=1 Tax=Fodinicurvata sp. EGI_FJ10296 TaxID=3231908 RepID=UPI0034561C22